MNPGSITTINRFDRNCRDFMSDEEWRDWGAYDAVLLGGRYYLHQARAGSAQSRVPCIATEDVEYTASDRIERRRVHKRARRECSRLLGKIRSAMKSGNMARQRVANDAYLCSYAAKLSAYIDAYWHLKKKHRPHIAVLTEYAAHLDPYKRSFEPARVRFERKSKAEKNSTNQRDYRQITSFGIHNLARQYLLLKPLEIYFADTVRNDQYAQPKRGRDKAVSEAIAKMRIGPYQFVAECDIENFFPSIGERCGRSQSSNTLYEQLPMFPRAVIESSVLSSGYLYTVPGEDALSRFSPDRGGIPQGSVLSSILAEHIVAQIMSEAEMLAACGQEMVGYADNIAVFGGTRDEVNGMIEPLASAARHNPHGEFRLQRSCSTRHKSEGLIFLGYYLRWISNGYVEVDVADKNKERFQAKLSKLLRKCRFSNYVSQVKRAEAIADVEDYVVDWLASFQLAQNINETMFELFEEVLSEQPAPIRVLFRNFRAEFNSK